MSIYRKSMMLLALGLLVFISTVSAQDETYTVLPGDSLQSIAAQFDVTVDMLAQVNGIIDPNHVRVGQTLTIPSGDSVALPTSHTVGPGENLRWIAERYNVTEESLIDLNDIIYPNSLFAGQVLTLFPAVGGPAVTVATGSTHVVQQGETLRSIAEAYGTTWQALAAANNLANPNYIFVTQVLTTIPATGGPVVQPTPVTPPTPVQPQPPQPRTHTVQQGEVLEQIAVRYGVTVESIDALNGITNHHAVFPGDVLQIPATGGPMVTQPQTATIPGAHIVQAGDTMFSIAARYGVNIYTLAQANGILNLNNIFVGQSLVIP